VCQAVVEVPEEPAEGADGVLTIAFRLPSGSRLSRRFHKADSVAVLAAYTTQQMSASGELAARQRVVLSTQFPKKVLEDAEQLLDAAGVEDRSILTVSVS
jgi:FAS-associated factor 2